MKYNLNDDEVMAKDEDFLKFRSNGLLLSDNDISILERNGINYLDYNTLEELIFAISEILEENSNDELDLLNIKLGEYNYYNYTNK